MSSRAQNIMIGILIVAVILLIWWALADAHDAPSGWQYPAKCCSDKDCQPVNCADFTLDGEGHLEYRPIHRSFSRNQVSESPDGLCHACYTARGEPLCAFVQTAIY
jgi:hypothetical protein